MLPGARHAIERPIASIATTVDTVCFLFNNKMKSQNNIVLHGNNTFGPGSVAVMFAMVCFKTQCIHSESFWVPKINNIFKIYNCNGPFSLTSDTDHPPVETPGGCRPSHPGILG
jgi:hypothetical protein